MKEVGFSVLQYTAHHSEVSEAPRAISKYILYTEQDNMVQTVRLGRQSKAEWYVANYTGHWLGMSFFFFSKLLFV